MRFENKPILIYGTEGPDFFPSNFSNEVYFSKMSGTHEKFSSYTSPFSIKLTLSGNETYRVNNKNFILKKGELLIVNRGSKVDYSVCSLKKQTNEGISIFIDELIIAEVAASYSTEPNLESNEMPDICLIEFYPTIDYRIENKRLSKKIEQLIQVFTVSKNHFNLQEDWYYEIAEDMICSHMQLCKKLVYLNKTKQATQFEIYKRIKKCKNVLENNIEENFSLDQLSIYSSLSKFNLIRYFKAIFGCTPKQYHIQLKAELAKKLLRTYSVSDVALQCGYPDIFSFSKQFKNVTGYSPVYYKEAI